MQRQLSENRWELSNRSLGIWASVAWELIEVARAERFSDLRLRHVCPLMHTHHGLEARSDADL
jgi:hypothetical protein